MSLVKSVAASADAPLAAWSRGPSSGRKPAAVISILLLGGLCGLPVTLAAESIVFTQIPVAAAGADKTSSEAIGAASGLPAGSRIVRFDPDASDGNVTILTPSFAAAGRPDVSFDGKRILFVGKQRAGEPLGMWEMDADGGGVERIRPEVGSTFGVAPDQAITRLVAGHANINKAIYLSTIYTIDADKPVYQIAFHSDADGSKSGSLFTCRMDGSRVRRITFDPYGVSGPFQLSDGRLLFSRSLGPPASDSTDFTGATDLMTVHTDGADLFPFAAVHEPPAVRSMPCETTDGWVYYVESTVGGDDPGGSLAVVRRSLSLHTRRVIADDSSGLFFSPCPLKGVDLLVSHRSTQDGSGLVTGEAGGSYGLWTVDVSTGALQTRIYDDPTWHEVDARVLGPRSIPDGRSSVVDDRVDFAHLYCLNAYKSDREEARTISPGQIRRLRLYRACTGDEAVSGAKGLSETTDLERHMASSSSIREELLGEAPIEDDGSFFLEVPPRTPLRMETLDAEGNVLQSMRSWVWVMPKGRRGCIGCHEDRELSPQNRHVTALRRRPTRVGLPYIPHDPFRGRRSSEQGGRK